MPAVEQYESASAAFFVMSTALATTFAVSSWRTIRQHKNIVS